MYTIYILRFGFLPNWCMSFEWFCFFRFPFFLFRLNRCLVSKLFDVCPRSTLEEIVLQDEVRVAWGTGIAGHVAESGEPVNIPDAYQVSSIRFKLFFSLSLSLFLLYRLAKKILLYFFFNNKSHFDFIYRMNVSIVTLICKRVTEQKHCFACQLKTRQVMWSVLHKWLINWIVNDSRRMTKR